MTTKWIVGLDLRPSSRGTLAFARWLSSTERAASSDNPTSFVGVHVLEEEHLRIVLRYAHLDATLEAAQAALDQQITAQRADDLVGERRVTRGLDASTALEEARRGAGAVGIIVGRQAERHEHRLVRLGKRARQILRELETPVFVVPPDLDASLVGSGPIVVATQAHEDSEEAARFGATLAGRLGRPIVFVQVMAEPQDYGAHYLSDEVLARVRTEETATTKRELDAWIGQLGLRGESVVLHGSTVEQLTRFASERQAPVLVTGSRRLGTFDRVFLVSIGSELAALASCTVAVVPPKAPPKT